MEDYIKTNPYVAIAYLHEIQDVGEKNAISYLQFINEYMSERKDWEIMRRFKTYVGTKIVMAKENTKDGKKGYTIVYPRGYESWCPKDVFEENNREITSEERAFIK